MTTNEEVIKAAGHYLRKAARDIEKLKTAKNHQRLLSSIVKSLCSAMKLMSEVATNMGKASRK